MPLDRYQQKRDFSKTPEPAGVEHVDDLELRFVVQKHAASRLHYDFRLEMEGVLRSWAVPKGPSYDTSQKRLAVEVEDHPLEYGDFEGVIPEGEYGGGTVMLWDCGTWEPHGDAVQMYRDGSMKFELRGSKLEGAWALVRMKRKTGDRNDNWLLIKERDRFATPLAERDVLVDSPRSAASGRTMEEIAERGQTLGTAGPGGEVDPASVRGAESAPLPERVEPELATAVDQLPEGDEWLHEMKLDGYRSLCRVSDGEARFFTRNGADWTDRFAALGPDVTGLPVATAWLDGEVVVLRPDGTTSFSALQSELPKGRSADIVFFAFDLLYLDGYDLRAATLADRKALLHSVLGDASGRVRYLDHVVGHGAVFHEQACSLALEGSVSKRVSSPYRPGRGRDWRKRKCLGREEFVVIGYTDSSGGRALGALTLGAEGPSGGLTYAGRVGTGFSDREAVELRARLEPLTSSAAAVEVPDAEAKGVHWVRPDVVVEVAFSEWTESGVLRHPSFVGIREDKPAKEVATRPHRTGESTVAGVKLTHPDKVLFDAAGATKRQLAEYYETVAEWILPHLADRPVVLVRCLHGSSGECFYQKDASTGFPDSIRTIAIEHDEGPVHYALIDGVTDLVALAQLGVLEIHTWGSRADDVERPDRLIFDLDPGPGVAWEAVVSAAVLMRDRLEALGLGAFVKTTGGKGLHIVTPIACTVGWGEARAATKAIADSVAADEPLLYTTNPLKDRRQGRIFIDYIRNTRGATAVCAYSTRARDRAPVSVPVRWDELEAGVRSDGYTISSVPRRLRALGSDPWAGYEDARATVSDALRSGSGVR